VWLVEFKRPGGLVSVAQKYHFIGLGELGHPVEVISSYAWFRRDLYQKLGLPVPPTQLGLALT